MTANSPNLPPVSLGEQLIRLKRLFFLGGLMAGITLTASATEFYHINGDPASINSADGELTDDAVDHHGSTKPPTKTEPAVP